MSAATPQGRPRFPGRLQGNYLLRILALIVQGPDGVLELVPQLSGQVLESLLERVDLAIDLFLHCVCLRDQRRPLRDLVKVRLFELRASPFERLFRLLDGALERLEFGAYLGLGILPVSVVRLPEPSPKSDTFGVQPPGLVLRIRKCSACLFFGLHPAAVLWVASLKIGSVLGDLSPTARHEPLFRQLGSEHLFPPRCFPQSITFLNIMRKRS